MYNIELHGIFTKIIAVCEYFGMWEENQEETIWRKAKKLLLLVFYITFLTSLASGSYLSKDWHEAVYLFCATMRNIVLTIKLYYMCWNGKLISTLLHDISKHSIGDYNEFIQTQNTVSNFVTFAKVFMSLTALAEILIATLCLPVFSSEKNLPWNIGFPLDWKASQISYWIAYSFINTASFMAFLISCFTVIVWYIMLSCSIKYRILGNQFRNMGAIELREPTVTTKSFTFVAKEQKAFLRHLVGLIRIHRQIQQLIDRVTWLFSNLLLVLITISGLCICSSIFVLSFNRTETSLIQSGVYLVILLYDIFDIFVVMNLGNEIKLSSNQLSHCLFESNWIKQSKTYKRNVIILMEIIKQPHELVIFKVYRLNLDTFRSILNLAYSMFNILTKFQ